MKIVSSVTILFVSLQSLTARLGRGRLGRAGSGALGGCDWVNAPLSDTNTEDMIENQVLEAEISSSLCSTKTRS